MSVSHVEALGATPPLEPKAIIVVVVARGAFRSVVDEEESRGEYFLVFVL